MHGGSNRLSKLTTEPADWADGAGKYVSFDHCVELCLKFQREKGTCTHVIHRCIVTINIK